MRWARLRPRSRGLPHALPDVPAGGGDVVGGYDAAHDAVQEGFARALLRRDRYRGEGSLEGWIWTTVLRTAREMRRRQTDVLSLHPDATFVHTAS